MKTIIAFLFVLCSIGALAQSNEPSPYYKRVFDAKYMDKPPVFSFGKDSLQRFYFAHFPAFDTVLRKAVENGDTAKYLRVYFSFNIDETGYVYDPKFERVASTRSSTTESAKTIKYYSDLRSILDKAIQQMMLKMPAWKPGLQDGIPVKTSNYDFLQFWVGLSAPQ